MINGTIPENTSDLFDLVKNKQNCKNEVIYGEFLEISKSLFYAIKKGERALTAEKGIKIASKAGLSPEAVLILLELENAQEGHIKALWNNILINYTSHNG